MMKMYHRRFLYASATAIALVSVGACSRPFDESRAQELLQTDADKTYYVSVNHLVPLMAPSTINFSDASLGGDSAILQQLIENGSVSQTATEINYPDPTGSWAFDKSEYGGTVIESYRLEVQILPGSNIITGKGEYWMHGSGVGSGTSACGITGRPCRGTFTGTVSPEGRVELELDAYGNIFSMGAKHASFQYEQSGETAFLRDANMTYRSTARPMMTIKRYEYGFTPKMGITASGVSAGQIEISSVSDLMLTLDTRATAHFVWTVTLNDVGRILLGGNVPSGTSNVEFAKKPDDTWNLAEQPRFTQ